MSATWAIIIAVSLATNISAILDKIEKWGSKR